MSNQEATNYRVISSARLAISSGEFGLSDAPALIKRILKEEMWREFLVVETGEIVHYDRFVDFVATPPLEGLGATVDVLARLCRGDAEAESLLDAACKRPRGWQGHESNASNRNITQDRPVGTTRPYALRRLEAQAPALHARVLTGELSPHAAMIEAGFRQKTLTVPTDPERAARALLRHFDIDALREIVSLIESELYAAGSVQPEDAV